MDPDPCKMTEYMRGAIDAIEVIETLNRNRKVRTLVNRIKKRIADKFWIVQLFTLEWIKMLP